MSANRKLMEALADARPRQLDPTHRPDPAVIMTHTQPAAVRETARRPARRLVLAGLVPTLAVAATGAVFLSTDGAAPDGGGRVTAEATGSTPVVPGSARELLLVAADRSVPDTATAGKHLVTARERGEVRPVGPTGRPYNIVRRHAVELWYPTVPDGTVTEFHQTLGAVPATPADVVAWQADGSPAQWVEAPPKDLPDAEPVVIKTTPGQRSYAQIPERDATRAGWVTPDQTAAMPTEAAALRKWLRKTWRAYSGQELSDYELFRTGVGLVLNLPLSPPLRAAAFRMLADLDGVTSLGPVKDRRGRAGMAVGYARKGDSGHWSQSRLIIDPQTGQPLADESWDLGPGQAPTTTGELLSYTLVTGSRYTTDAPPIESAMPRGRS